MEIIDKNHKIGELALNNIYCIDCVLGMQKMPENSVDLIVTSPSYENLR